MKGLILILLITLFTFSSFAEPQSKRFLYRGERRSLTDWSKVDPMKWSDYSLWLKKLKLREATPAWENIVAEKKLIETVGYILDCVGECRVHRGEGSFTAQYRSSIKEGDELHTVGDSYTWAFLVDGTMVRLSPNTSVTFKEINIGKKENFLHARLNNGNVLWLSRQSEDFKVSNDRETDSIFYPLELYEATSIKESVEFDEDNLFALLDDSHEITNQYERLNKYINENNKWINNKKTYTFLIMPNGSIAGHNISIEAISLFGGESFVKNRSFSQMRLSSGEGDSPEFYYRGFANTKTSRIDENQWYKVDRRGRQLKRFYLSKLFKMGEFLTSQIPTIYIARELWLKKYSQGFFGEIDKAKLGQEFGYRLWGSLEDDTNLDLRKRLEFLIDFTRRIETTNILTTERFLNRMDNNREFIQGRVYGRSFFNTALVDYYTNRAIFDRSDSDKENLNSTKKLYWKKLHDIK